MRLLSFQTHLSESLQTKFHQQVPIRLLLCTDNQRPPQVSTLFLNSISFVFHKENDNKCYEMASANRAPTHWTNVNNVAVVTYITKHVPLSKEDFHKLDILMKKQQREANGIIL